MIRGLAGCIISFVVLLTPSAQGQDTLVQYDDFSDPKIDINKWRTMTWEPAGVISERGVKRGRLELRQTAFGRTKVNIGNPVMGAVGLRMVGPISISVFQADVAIESATAQGCLLNPDATRARAQIAGSFFNDGSSLRRGDLTGDIRAIIQKVGDSNVDNRIEALVLRCANARCSYLPAILFHTFSTPAPESVTDTLRLRWEPLKNRFIFAVNPGVSDQEAVALSYNRLSITDNHPAALRFRQLSVGHEIARCVAGRRKASLTGLFDNVTVNR